MFGEFLTGKFLQVPIFSFSGRGEVLRAGGASLRNSKNAYFRGAGASLSP